MVVEHYIFMQTPMEYDLPSNMFLASVFISNTAWCFLNSDENRLTGSVFGICLLSRLIRIVEAIHSWIWTYQTHATGFVWVWRWKMLVSLLAIHAGSWKHKLWTVWKSMFAAGTEGATVQMCLHRRLLQYSGVSFAPCCHFVELFVHITHLRLRQSSNLTNEQLDLDVTENLGPRDSKNTYFKILSWSFSHFPAQWWNMTLWKIPPLDKTRKRILNHSLLIFVCIDQMQYASTHHSQISPCFHNAWPKTFFPDKPAYPGTNNGSSTIPWLTLLPHNFNLKI